MNTVDVKTLKILKKTMQGEKVELDEDQSGKDQSDLFDRDSSDSFSAQQKQITTVLKNPTASFEHARSEPL